MTTLTTPVDLFTWTGQPKSEWPYWVTQAVGHYLPAWETYGAGLILRAEHSEWVVEAGQSIVRLPNARLLVFTPEETALLLKLDTAGSPSLSQAPSPTSTPSTSLPGLPWDAQDHVVAVGTATAGEKGYFWFNKDNTRKVAAADPNAAGETAVTFMTPVFDEQADLLRVKGSDGKFYVVTQAQYDVQVRNDR